MVNRLGLGFLALLLLSSSPAWAVFSMTLEPIVGYERTQKLVPTAHTTDRLVYGGRLTAGILLISLEAEYLRAMDTESFPADDLATKDTTDRAKLGARSTIKLATLVSLIVRAGAQATRNIHDETVAGITTTTSEPIRYDPYGGIGARVALGRQLSLSADIVAVFRAFPNMNQNEYQTTAGLAVSFP